MKVPKDSFVFSIVPVEENKRGIKFNAPDYLQYFLKTKKLGAKGTATLDFHEPTRSTSQLNYYFAIVTILANEQGYTKEEMHEWLMIGALGTKTVTINGITREVRKSMSKEAKLSKDECGTLIDYTLACCADLSVRVPTKEELGYL